MNDLDREFLKRCVVLATEALESGSDPFGSILVGSNGSILREDYNRTADGDQTQHPEFALARWAAANMSAADRLAATVYTSGEHCPMCAAAHGWVGLGRIVYASSSVQLSTWFGELATELPPVATLPIKTVVPHVVIDGPDPDLAEQIRDLHRKRHDARPRQ